jgi:hypothetical protein
VCPPTVRRHGNIRVRPALYPKWLSLDPSPLTPCHPSILRGKNKENDVRSSGTVFNVESAG